MSRKKIELQILNITSSSAQAGAYALLLGEVNGSRQLPIIIGSFEAQSLVIELKGVVPPRPLTHTLFSSVLSALGVQLLRVLIYKADNGVFYSYLYLKSEETIYRVDARTSDGIALAIRMNAPILIYDDVLEAECLKMGISLAEEEDAPHRHEAFREKTLEQLKSALQDAIAEEDYERAAQLRDIINQHQGLQQV